MADQNRAFTVYTWTELIETLAAIQQEGPMQEAGMRVEEVTDLVQAQLFRDQPLLALRMARVVEVRFAAPQAVLYLRTGIFAGSERAEPEAGALLPALRVVDPETGACGFVRQARVKRGATWRQNLRRRLRDVLRESDQPHLTATYSLTEIMTPEADDLEADLALPHLSAGTRSRSAVPQAEGDDLLDGLIGGDVLAAATPGWSDLRPAGVSLPVWMSVTAALSLVLTLLLRA